MNVDAVATRMAVLTRALPHRILLVDDDELEMELIADRLATAGFEVTRAANGEEALKILAERWYPVVITDWQMPVMDGIAFTESLRSRGGDDTYIIMLTMRDAHMDYERGYVSGVDDYLSKKVPDIELFSRINAAFNTLALRRSLRETQAALEDSVIIDAQSGAFAPSELRKRLHTELRRAQRYGRQLSLIAINVVDPNGAAPAPDVLKACVQAIDGCIRAHVDWVGRHEAERGAIFALVLPEAGVIDTPAIKERVMQRLLDIGQDASVALTVRLGVSALDRGMADGAQVEATDMLEVALLCMQCPGCSGDEQLRAVQRSVGGRLAIVCRHGYSVDAACSLKVADGRVPRGLGAVITEVN